MQKLHWLPILMGVTILGITGFQGYWLKNNYDREKQNLEIKTNVDFRQAILHLQASKLKLEKVNIQLKDSMPQLRGLHVRPRRNNNRADTVNEIPKEAGITMMNLVQERMREYETDPGRNNTIIISSSDGSFKKGHTDSSGNRIRGNFRSINISGKGDSLVDPALIREIKMGADDKETKTGSKEVTIKYGHQPGKKGEADSLTVNTTGVFIDTRIPDRNNDDLFGQRIRDNDPGRNAVFRLLYNIDSLSIKDSVTIKEITDAYSAKLKEDKMNLAFSVSRLDSAEANSTAPNEVTIGFAKPASFRLMLENKVSYLLKKLTLPILFSLFLVGITVVSFVLLYRNVVRQRRLAELKNEFISNITHELKTPIATVGVAIEALKNFNAMHDPQRTKEYLDISQNELQRLSLLVDKVLKLSMFEKNELELKKEQFDCKQLAEEVMNSMRLQFEKHHAKTELHIEGNNFIIEADKLHITSVIYNLLDNALKYSKEEPLITVRLKSKKQHIELSVEDNGIGIPAEYKGKVFDKFFRVPTGDRHNAKGYGLGLSYVSEILKKHMGFITVESELGRGSIFTAYIPYKELPVIQFDEHRKILKKQ